MPVFLFIQIGFCFYTHARTHTCTQSLLPSLQSIFNSFVHSSISFPASLCVYPLFSCLIFNFLTCFCIVISPQHGFLCAITSILTSHLSFLFPCLIFSFFCLCPLPVKSFTVLLLADLGLGDSTQKLSRLKELYHNTFLTYTIHKLFQHQQNKATLKPAFCFDSYKLHFVDS